MRLTLFLVFLCQIGSAQNLVENPGFEEYYSLPTGLSQFFRVKNWTGPTTGSPDYYNGSVKESSPRTGDGYAGIILKDKYPDIVEYIQTQLVRPLEKKKYFFKMYVLLSKKSVVGVNIMDACFVTERVKVNKWEPIPLIPQVINPRDRFITDMENWTEVSGTYNAKGGERFIIIGNFSPEKTQTVETIEAKKNTNPEIQAYYFIDDVALYPADSIPVEHPRVVIKKDSVESVNKITEKVREKTETAKVILDTLYFPTSGAELSALHIQKLKKISEFLAKEEFKKVEISGHTDNMDTYSKNLILSQNRCASVEKYLVYNGIDAAKLKCKGFGETMPASDNNTEQGRILNRRVEIKTIKY